MISNMHIPGWSLPNIKTRHRKGGRANMI